MTGSICEPQQRTSGSFNEWFAISQLARMNTDSKMPKRRSAACAVGSILAPIIGCGLAFLCSRLKEHFAGEALGWVWWLSGLLSLPASIAAGLLRAIVGLALRNGPRRAAMIGLVLNAIVGWRVLYYLSWFC